MEAALGVVTIVALGVVTIVALGVVTIVAIGLGISESDAAFPHTCQLKL